MKELLGWGMLLALVYVFLTLGTHVNWLESLSGVVCPAGWQDANAGALGLYLSCDDTVRLRNRQGQMVTVKLTPTPTPAQARRH